MFDDVALQTDLAVVHVVTIAIDATGGDLEDKASVALGGNLVIGAAVHHARTLVRVAITSTSQWLAAGDVDVGRRAVANLEPWTGEGGVASELIQLSDVVPLYGRSPFASWGMVDGRRIGVGE